MSNVCGVLKNKSPAPSENRGGLKKKHIMDKTTKEDIKLLHEQIKMLATDVQVIKACNLVILELLLNKNKDIIKRNLKRVDSIHASHQIQYEKDIDRLIQVIFEDYDETHLKL